MFEFNRSPIRLISDVIEVEKSTIFSDIIPSYGLGRKDLYRQRLKLDLEEICFMGAPTKMDQNAFDSSSKFEEDRPIQLSLTFPPANLDIKPKKTAILLDFQLALIKKIDNRRRKIKSALLTRATELDWS